MYIMYDSIVPESDTPPQDRDLIEILWKQDIDLGVSRDAYDSRPCEEFEKLKVLELSKDNFQDFYSYGDKKICEENETPIDPFAGLNYTIDSETGEFLFDDLSGLSEEESSGAQLLENETFGALNQDAFLAFKDDVQLSNLSDVFPSGEFPDLTPENYSDSEYILSQIEDIGKEFELYTENGKENETVYSQPGDAFASPDGCWPNSSTMLPLLATGNIQPSPYVPPSSHMEPIYHGGTPSLPVHHNLPNRTNDNLDNFAEILHSASSETAISDETFQAITSSLGTPNVGCALAESFTALHNETDSIIPSNFISTLYNTNMPDLLYFNQNLSLPSEMLNHSIRTDDDYQLIAVTSEETLRMLKEDHIDESSDSASIGSGRVPSVSDSHDWMDSYSETSSQNSGSRSHSVSTSPKSEIHNQNTDFYQSSFPPKRFKNFEDNVDGNQEFSRTSFEDSSSNGQYFSIKSEYSDVYESCSRRTECEVTSFRKFDFSNTGSPAAICNSILQHNHSYHLPFASEDSRYKPVVRDKGRIPTEEETRNKDEKRAKELNLPISIDDIINLSIDEYNERLSKYELTEQQLHLIRDIRRRGKNKVAAQNCRKRKMDQINNLQQDLDVLYNEKMQLKTKQGILFQQKQNIEGKYSQLFQIVSQFSNYNPPALSNPLPVHNNNQMTVPASSDAFMPDDDTDLSRGARVKRKFKK